jgi:PTS system N-acetylgalactosamine-specific IIA component
MMSSVVGIVAAHGSLAPGLVSAVHAITGRGDALLPLSNEGMSGAEVAESLARAVDQTGATVIFTDLPAGSCTIAARRVQRDRRNLTVVIGANLPMLLEFVLRDSHGPEELAAAVTRGRDYVRIFPPADGG